MIEERLRPHLCRGKDLKDLKHEIYFLILTVNNEQKHSATKKRIMREGIRNAVTGIVEGRVDICNKARSDESEGERE